MSPKDNYASLRRENRELKLELARLRMRLNDLEKEHVCMKRNMEKSNSRKFMSSFSKKISKLNLFGHSSSRESTSPSRNSQRTDSKLTWAGSRARIFRLAGVGPVATGLGLSKAHE
ncbi:putative NPH3/RPT2-like family protein [Helianthus anomalus]